jgi:hypothetical protein
VAKVQKKTIGDFFFTEKLKKIKNVPLRFHLIKQKAISLNEQSYTIKIYEDFFQFLFGMGMYMHYDGSFI